MEQRKKLGEILVENGIITLRSVERVLPRAKKLGRKFGTVLEELGLITDDELANALALQFGYKVVKNLGQFTFPADLLKLLTADVALQNQLFPLKSEKG